jgi:hypothetical protein
VPEQREQNLSAERQVRLIQLRPWSWNHLGRKPSKLGHSLQHPRFRLKIWNARQSKFRGQQGVSLAALKLDVMEFLGLAADERVERKLRQALPRLMYKLYVSRLHAALKNAREFDYRIPAWHFIPCTHASVATL